MCTGSLSEPKRVTDGQHTTLVRLLMFNSDCNLFSQPVIQLLEPRSQSAAPRGAGESSGSELGPSLSITFNICLSGTFNLFYSTTPLDSTDLPDPLESNEMATLMSVSVLTGRTNCPVGIFKRRA